MDQAPTVAGVLADLVRRPRLHFVSRWHWKSALLSSLLRGFVFLGINVRHGAQAGLQAMGAEIAFCALTAGFFGSLIQSFRKAKPDWAATAAILFLVPAVSHLIEFLIHWASGTVELKKSILASVAVSAVSALFHLHVMRQGVFLVDGSGHTLAEDLKRIPAMIASFLTGGRQSANGH